MNPNVRLPWESKEAYHYRLKRMNQMQKDRERYGIEGGFKRKPLYEAVRSVLYA